MNSPLTSFVNQARNIVWLSGMFRRLDAQTGIICASSDHTQGIHISLRPGAVVPKDGELTECMCHAHGVFDRDTNTRSIRLTGFYFKRPTLKNLPAKSRLQVFAPDNPLASISDIKENIRRAFAGSLAGEINEREVADIANTLAKSANSGDFGGGFTNKAIITGFVGAKVMRMATETEDAHLYVQLHQFPDTETSLPIRIYGTVQGLREHLRTLFPINVVGTIAFEDKTDGDGNTRRAYYIKVSKNNIGAASANDFQHRSLPSWWMRAFANHQRQLEQQKKGAVVVGAEAIKSDGSGSASPEEHPYADL